MLTFHFQYCTSLQTGKLLITSTFSTSLVSLAEDIEGFLPRKNPYSWKAAVALEMLLLCRFLKIRVEVACNDVKPFHPWAFPKTNMKCQLTWPPLLTKSAACHLLDLYHPNLVLIFKGHSSLSFLNRFHIEIKITPNVRPSQKKHLFIGRVCGFLPLLLCWTDQIR